MRNLRIEPKLNSLIRQFVNVFIFIISIFIIMWVPDVETSLTLLGWWLIFVSIFLIIGGKNNKTLYTLLIIIALINISVGVNDCLLRGVSTSAWQITGLRSNSYNEITAKTIILFTATLNLFVKKSHKYEEHGLEVEDTEETLVRKNNNIITYVGIFVLYTILLYGFFSQVLIRTQGSYESVGTAIFEYGVIVLCVVWYYSGNNKVADWLIMLYVATYSVMFLYIGDRSSVFMYLIMIYLLYFQKRFSAFNVFILAVVGIVLANCISALRDGSSLSTQETIKYALERGLYIDTVSWSYYTGISIVGLSMIVPSRLPFCMNYILSFVGLESDMANFNKYASENYSVLFNRGGGLCSPYLYMFGGYIGVFIGALIISFILNRFFTTSRNNNIIYQYVIVAMSMRWYLYNPVTLFRGIIILLSLLLLFCNWFNSHCVGIKKT